MHLYSNKISLKKILGNEPFDTIIAPNFMQVCLIYGIMQQWFPPIVGPSSPFTQTIHPYTHKSNQVNKVISSGLKEEMHKIHL